MALFGGDVPAGARSGRPIVCIRRVRSCGFNSPNLDEGMNITRGVVCIRPSRQAVTRYNERGDGARSDAKPTTLLALAMPSTHFDLIAHWTIHAPVDRVWAALAQPEEWPLWWSCVRAVRTLRAGDAEGVGGIRRIRWLGRLPWETEIEIETVEALRPERLRGRSRGMLRADGIWLLRADSGDRTAVTCVWRVELASPWMRWLAPLVALAFRWNHAGFMRAGEAGLARHLAGPRCGGDPCG